MNEEGLEKLKELVEDQRVAMLTTVGAAGTLHSRPMWTEELDGQCCIWLLTNRGSEKVQELSGDGRVNLSYSDPGRDLYVSISGTATLVDDRPRAARYWKPAYRAWFPKGPDDPDLVVMRVQVEQAEYWDRSNRTMKQLMALAKAVLTGERHEPAGNAEIDLH